MYRLEVGTIGIEPPKTKIQKNKAEEASQEDSQALSTHYMYHVHVNEDNVLYRIIVGFFLHALFSFLLMPRHLLPWHPKIICFTHFISFGCVHLAASLIESAIFNPGNLQLLSDAQYIMKEWRSTQHTCL